MRGNFNAWDIVPAILALAAPVIIEELILTTLGFNRKNTIELIGLLDQGKVGAVSIVCSCYFRDASATEFGFMADEITAHKQRIIATRNHSKLILMHLSDGRKVTVESSANLRTCNNIEQFCMTNDPALYEFHKGWIEEVFSGKKEDRKATQKDRPRAGKSTRVN